MREGGGSGVGDFEKEFPVRILVPKTNSCQ